MDNRNTIIKHLVENKAGQYDPEKVADIYSLSEGQVISAAKKINDHNDWILIGEGWGLSEYSITLKESEREVVKFFLNEGGFTAIQKTSAETIQLLDKKLHLELEQMRQQINHLREESRRSKWSLRISWLAMLISAVSLLLYAYTIYHVPAAH